MPIDFNKPATTDNYSTAFVPNITNALKALGQMLDPATAGTLTNTPTGAHRLNSATGIFEFFNGTSWAERTMGYAKLSGATFTGAVSGITNLTTTGNTILGNAQADTLNVGNGDIIKDNAGKVGFGVTPATKVHAKGVAEILRIETTAARGLGQAHINFNDPTGLKGYLGWAGSADDNLYLINALNASIHIGNNNSTSQVTIGPSGNVGIGGVPTTAILEIYQAGTAAGFQVRGTSSGAGLTMVGNFTNGTDADFNIDLSQVGSSDKFARIGTSVAQPLYFKTSNTTRMGINSAGDVVIGGNLSPVSTGLTVQENTVHGGRLTLSNKVVNGASHTIGQILFDAYRDVASPSFVAAIRCEGISAAGNRGDLVFCTMENGNANVPTERMRIRWDGFILDAAGNELGYKGLPQNSQGAGYTLVYADRGKHVYMFGASATCTVPASLFGIGDAVTIVNGTTGNITLAQGASVTLRKVNSASTGNFTIAQWGMATIVCVAANVFHVSGVQ